MSSNQAEIQKKSVLLPNAIRFGRGSTIQVSTQIACNDKGDFVTVKVSDSGEVIDKEIVPQLFTKFSAKKFEGGTGWDCILPRVSLMFTADVYGARTIAMAKVQHLRSACL
jgi:hypothetical protein